MTPAAGETAAGIRRLFLLSAWIRPGPGTLEEAGRLIADPGTAEGAAAVARRVSMEPLLLDFVTARFPGAPLCPGTRSDLEGQSRLHAFRWAEIREALEAALDALATRGIRPILLKGASHAGECYDPPRLRPMRDIDLLVGEAEIEPARSALQEGGFSHEPGAHPPERYASHHHIPPLFHRSTGICLEVHHHLMRLPPRFEGFPPIEEIRRGARESRLFPGRALVLDPALQVLNTCIHITHGDTIGRRAQNLFDLARAIEVHGPAIDWDLLARHASSADVARSLAFPLLYLAGEGLASAPAARLAGLRRLSGLRRWEIGLLTGLTNRYRIGAPAAWGLVSGRISNILWRRAFERRSAAARAVSALREIIRRPAARAVVPVPVPERTTPDRPG